MAIAGVIPYAWETKEGELKYNPKELAKYNERHNNTLNDEAGLYTTEQVEEILLNAAEFWIDEYDYYNDQFITVDYDLEVYDFMKSREED